MLGGNPRTSTLPVSTDLNFRVKWLQYMECPPSGSARIDSFALVCYLPGPLGTFLDRLRAELVVTCSARSHVTILPPRPLAGPEASAKRQISDFIPERLPFHINLGQVEVFPETKVVYLGLTCGEDHLRNLHDSLNSSALGFAEPFVYHPHVTLAQGLNPDDVQAATELATGRWSEFQHSRSFQVETLTFVQNTTTNRWIDLVEYELGSMAAVRR